MLSWEHIYELVLQAVVRGRLIDSHQRRQFEEVRYKYATVCDKLLDGSSGSRTPSLGYDWSSWASTIRQAFARGVPLDFLRHPTLANTMVFARRRGVRLSEDRLAVVLATFGEITAQDLLREDYIGLPTISNASYLTSANRCHQASHLAYYTRECQRKFWDNDTIVEWGGGYGGMARIIRRLNPAVTYTIIDLPELLALQYVYLSAVFGEDVLSLVDRSNPRIGRGQINLMASEAVADIPDFNCDAFVSTWALTESPRSAQMMVIDRRFFMASHLLMASMVNENNFLFDSTRIEECVRLPIPTVSGIGSGNEYWFR